jgi:hypothetical protein
VHKQISRYRLLHFFRLKLVDCSVGTAVASPWTLKEKPTISGDTGSDSATAQICRWLQTCSDSHGNFCSASEPQGLPTRVVEILGPTEVRLKVTNDAEIARYTTLSHAWGNGNTARTTTSTLISFQDNIPWSLLPKTFQEAIHVTRRLGLKYIWIDSLCIVQDNDEDWRQEGSQMVSTYSRSYLTIAATKSSSSAGGCFAVSDPRYVGRAYELKDAHGVEYTVHVREQLFYDGKEKTNFPLLFRAWVFQERLLSTRILHFGPEEMLWECMSCETCECGASHDLHGKHLVSPWESPTFSHTLTDGWHTAVSVYSKLTLTFETDIFPALQGIAKRVQEEEKKCAYYAGLWKVSLLRDLLWFYGHPGIRVQSWRAPSWSWATAKGIPQWAYWTTKTKFEPYFSVLEVSTEPIGSDPLGQLKAGILKLEGLCFTTISLAYDESDQRYVFRQTCPGNGQLWGPTLKIFFDVRYTRVELQNASLLLMKAARRKDPEDKHWSYDFLIFGRVENEESVYKRLGLAELNCCVSGFADYIRCSGWREKRKALYHFDRAAKLRTFTVI